MRTPKAEDLLALRGKSADEYAQWLKLGLSEYLFEKRGRYAFPGATNFIEQRSGISDDLAAIVKALDARDQEAFGNACAIVLRSLDFSDERDAVISKELLRLGAKIRALGLLKVLTEKAFRLSNGKHTFSLYELAFEYARDLADLKSPDAADCLRHLIRSSGYFRPALAGRALVALTEADPVNFADHYDQLQDALDQNYGYHGIESESLENRARRRELIEDIAARLANLKLLMHPCKPGSGPRPEVTNWWLNTLKNENEFRTIYAELLGVALALPKPDITTLVPQRRQSARRIRLPRKRDQRPSSNPQLDLFRAEAEDALGITDALIASDFLSKNRDPVSASP